MAESQVPFRYAADDLAALSETLSAPRLRSYLRAAGHDHARALRLYLWNARLSKAMRYPLEMAELSLRNRINVALCDTWGRQWPHGTHIRAHLTPKALSSLNEAVTAYGNHAQADTIVAALSFGFWTSIVSASFEQDLWRMEFHKAFPNYRTSGKMEGDIEDVQSHISDARYIRNRISHLEPIHRKDVTAYHAKIIKIIQFSCSKTAKWVRHHSTLAKIHRDGPDVMAVEADVFSASSRKIQIINGSMNLKAALGLISGDRGRWLLAEGASGYIAVTPHEVGLLMEARKSDGIVDLEAELVQDMFALVPAMIPIRRNMLTIDALKMDNKSNRYFVVTENGKAGERPIGVFDLLSVVS